MGLFDRFKKTPDLRESPNYYGDTKTIHGTGHVDIETYNGEVVAVWFRCTTLPFEQHTVGKYRADEMRAADGFTDRPIRGIEFEES